MKLTEKEATNLELNKLRSDLSERDIHVRRLESVIADLKHKLVVHENSTKIQNLLNDKENLRVKRVEEVTAIRDRLGIEGPFGFDPDTLEIVTDQEG